MRRLLAWLATVVIGILVLALSAFFAVMQSPKETGFSKDTSKGLSRPIPHDFENRKNCNECHLPESMVPYPADHLGFSEEECTGCHRPPQDP